MSSAAIHKLSVIVPVYSGATQAIKCIESVLRAKCRKSFRMIVVYDCGPEPALLRDIQSYSANGDFDLLVNKTNMGFVCSVNRAIAHCPEDDVVILNSDTVVSDGWLDQLVGVAERDALVGTVTPLSNNAEICSFPIICRDNQIPPRYSIDLINQILQKYCVTDEITIPTGVGFCMLIRRSALNRAGLFDEASFGRGYGEENDFCRRILRYGYRNVVCTTAWVFHEGGVSFGDEKARLIALHSEIIQRRYPDYFPAVHSFVREDPLKSIRLRGVLGLMAEAHVPTVLMISHGLGGGTKRHVNELIELHGRSANIVLIEPVMRGRVAVKLPTWLWAAPIEFDLASKQELLLQTVAAIKPALVHIHHIKGLESIICEILDAARTDHIVTLHDFYLIAGNPTLTDENGRFELDRAKDPERMRADLKLATGTTWEQWTDITERLLRQAKKIMAPTPSVGQLYEYRFPQLPISDVRHLDAELFGVYPPVKTNKNCGLRTTRVAVIGALGKEKGADVLERVAALAVKNKLKFEFHLLGYAYRPLNGSVVVHGAYKEQDLKQHLRHLDPDFVWYPCQWPETYSYTLSAVLEAGLPVLVPALGALETRIEQRPFSRCVRSLPSDSEWLQELVDFAKSLEVSRDVEQVWKHQSQVGGFYQNAYLGLISRAPKAPATDEVPSTRDLAVLLSDQRASAPGLGERIVHGMVFIRDLPGIRRLSSLIPIRTQRYVKRLFVKVPLHEIESFGRAKPEFEVE